MQHISLQQFENVRSILVKHRQECFPLIDAVLSGFQNGMVFMDDLKEPGTVFVINSFGFSQYFLLRDKNIDDCFIDFLSHSSLLPCYFHIYNSTQPVAELLEAMNVKTRLRERQQLRYQSKLPIKIECPSSYTLALCSEIGFDKLEPFNLHLDSKFWPSKEAFLQSSNGVCLVNNTEQPVSICYAACNVHHIAEIDIATLPEYQHQGLALTVAKAFVNRCISHGISPNWDCFTENIGSLKIAEKIGFNVLKKYHLLSVYNEKRNA